MASFVPWDTQVCSLPWESSLGRSSHGSVLRCWATGLTSLEQNCCSLWNRSQWDEEDEVPMRSLYSGRRASHLHLAQFKDRTESELWFLCGFWKEWLRALFSLDPWAEGQGPTGHSIWGNFSFLHEPFTQLSCIKPPGVEGQWVGRTGTEVSGDKQKP